MMPFYIIANMKHFLIIIGILFLNVSQAMENNLYKIVTVENWQASQDLVKLNDDDKDFIHFSTEEQLERILSKYWAHIPQYFILKIDSSKLPGKMVFETNPGGSGTKYYHLYDGNIPKTSIMEVKEISRVKPITQVGDEVLRKVARPLTKEEILSPEIQNLIISMRDTMRAAPGVGLAAPQIGVSLQIAVIEDPEDFHKTWTPQQLAEQGRVPVPFHVIINPKLTLEGEMVDFFEGCLSFPHYRGLVSRAKKVRLECLNEKGEPVVIHAEGWYARIIQHEYDHLQGIIYLDKAKPRSITSEANFQKIWKNKSMQEISSMYP